MKNWVTSSVNMAVCTKISAAYSVVAETFHKKTPKNKNVNLVVKPDLLAAVWKIQTTLRDHFMASSFGAHHYILEKNQWISKRTIACVGAFMALFAGFRPFNTASQ